MIVGGRPSSLARWRRAEFRLTEHPPRTGNVCCAGAANMPETAIKSRKKVLRT